MPKRFARVDRTGLGDTPGHWIGIGAEELSDSEASGYSNTARFNGCAPSLGVWFSVGASQPSLLSARRHPAVNGNVVRE
jgi:hypothetical protein